MDEFSFIAALLAPLAAKEKGALGLKDDAAVLSVPRGFQLVVTQDALTQGVHFIGDEAAGLIARKLLRANLSDLAAMGARPWGYFLTLMLPESLGKSWLSGFAAGLRRDQKEYGVTLMGGDTTRTKGPLSLSATALGLVPKGKALKRNGAKTGDGVFVSGTLGDAALGLQEAKGKGHKTDFRPSPLAPRPYLIRHYQLPEPRIALGQALRGVATACMDVSDGLMQDLGHICAASRVGADICWRDVPLSQAARAALKQVENPYACVLAGGDDYELLFTAPLSARRKLEAIAKATGAQITLIGRVTRGKGARALDGEGKEIALARTGWRHF